MWYLIVKDGVLISSHEGLNDAIKEASTFAQESGIEVDIYQRSRCVRVETKTVVEEYI